MAHRNCPACANTSYSPAGEKSHFKLGYCRKCGTLFSLRLPNVGEEQDYDDYGYENQEVVPDFINKRCDELVRPFAKYRSTNRFRDVGFGAGTIIRAAARAGWNVSGCEISNSAVKALESQHPEFDLHCGTLESRAFEGDQFVVISIVEVIEHVPDPSPILKEAFRILRPGGIMWVTTPNLDSLSYKALGINWSMVAPPDHIDIYSKKGASILIQSCGFTIDRLETFGINPHEIHQYYKGGKKEVSASERLYSGYELNEALEGRESLKVIKNVVNSVLNLTKQGDGLKIGAEKPLDR